MSITKEPLNSTKSSKSLTQASPLPLTPAPILPMKAPPVPPAPPLPPPPKPLTLKPFNVNQVVDLQSRAKTIRIGKVRWPPAPNPTITFEYELQK